MLVTSDGQWVLENDSEFLRKLGDPAPDYDAAAFAVKNLGFIKFQMLDDSLIEIELHPRNVALPALLAVQQQLLSSKVRLFRIKFFEQSWKSEISSSAEATVARLSELCAPAFSPLPSHKYVVEPRDYTALLKNSDSPLRLMAQKWRVSFGQFSPNVISFAIEHRLLSRLMIFGVIPNKGEPVFRFIGDGFDWLERDYQFHGIGEKVQNQPDKEYGEWVAEFYRNVAASGQPRYDDVTAGIRSSSDPGRVQITRYERLLLPWRTPSEEVFVSMLSRKVVDRDASELETTDSEKSLKRISSKST
jgi:hypothetical protein